MAPSQPTPARPPASRAAALATALALAAALTAAVLCAPTAPASAQGAATAAGTPPGPPNVIVVMTDDQNVAELNRETMPATLNALKRHGNGTDFTESIVSSPLCCPARAGYITGQYPHNNNVYDNEPGYGSLNEKRSTVYGWMQAAGYRTGHLGRFLLNYDRPAAPGDPPTDAGLAPPPGIEHWFGYIDAGTRYYGARFSRNGTPVELGSDRASYTTRSINREARTFVSAAQADPRPFFLTVSHLAPHSTNDPPTTSTDCGGGVPLPDGGKLGKFKREPLPKPPSFDESAIRDKPHWVRTRPGLGSKRRANLKRGWRCALATLTTVDNGVRALIKQLDRQGELGNTAIFFTSDNGYFFGEHRIFLNKVYPYEEAIRVPLLARVPEHLLAPRVKREGRPKRSSVPVNNLDLTATILDLAGAAPCTTAGACRTLDGRPLTPLLSGKRPGWSRGRALLVQLGGIRDCGQPPPERGLKNFYDAVRTKRRVYVELNRVNPDTGVCDRPEFELYDLRQDPFQMRNRAINPARRAPASEQSSLAGRLQKLRSCAGIAGRDPASAVPFCE